MSLTVNKQHFVHYAGKGVMGLFARAKQAVQAIIVPRSIQQEPENFAAFAKSATAAHPSLNVDPHWIFFSQNAVFFLLIAINMRIHYNAKIMPLLLTNDPAFFARIPEKARPYLYFALVILLQMENDSKSLTVESMVRYGVMMAMTLGLVFSKQKMLGKNVGAGVNLLSDYALLFLQTCLLPMMGTLIVSTLFPPKSTELVIQNNFTMPGPRL